MTRLAACCLLLAAPLAAQQPTDSIAVAGAGGVYVWLGGTVVSSAHPVDGAVAHRLERRRVGAGAGAGDWSVVGDVAAVRDGRAFFAPLDSGTRAAVRAALGARSDDAAWERIVRFPRADSLSLLLGHETIRLALGFYALDKDVRPGDRWQYRVSNVDAQGRAAAPVVSTPVAFPAAGLTDSIHTLRTGDRESGGIIWWRLDPRTRIRWVEIWRRRGTSGEFARIDSVGTFLRSGDSLLVGYRDAGLAPGAAYQYYALPRGFFFTAGPASDTVTVYTVDDRRLAVPESLVVKSDSGGIALAWRLPTIGLARAVRVWRSVRQDSGWYRLTELPGDARRFTDDRAAPMTLYYYRLTVLGVRGQESPPTGAVFGYFRAPAPPEAPSLVRVGGASGRLRIGWTPNREPDIKGYYIYRTDAPGDSLGRDTSYALVSPLVPAGDSSWVDSAAVRVAGRQWRFAVRAVNTSDRMSEFSPPASAPAALDLDLLPPLAAPTGVRAFVRDARVRLMWDAVPSTVLTAQGYEVLRRTENEGSDTTFRPLVTGRLGASDNAVWDSTVVLGRRYSYAVRGVGGDGTKSTLSVPAMVELVPTLPAAPADVRARATPEGIEIMWGSIDGVRGKVRLYRAAPGVAARLLAEVELDPAVYVDRSAQPGVRYFYAASLVVDGREGARSLQAPARR